MAIKSLKVLPAGMQTDCDKGYFTLNVDQGKKVDGPFVRYLIRADEGNILVDTGILPDDAPKAAAVGGPVTIQPGEMLPAQLQAEGLSTKDIDLVIVTHLHFDHAGWLTHLSHAEVIVQEEEYRFAMNPPQEASIFYLPERFNLDRKKWRMIDGDKVLFPGLTILFTPGHTPGSQSVMVDLPGSGPVIIVGDAGFLQENFERELIPASFGSPRDALLSIRRLKVWAEVRHAQIFPTHDARLWCNKTAAAMFYT